jgi:hypothetical protein
MYSGSVRHWSAIKAARSGGTASREVGVAAA